MARGAGITPPIFYDGCGRQDAALYGSQDYCRYSLEPQDKPEPLAACLTAAGTGLNLTTASYVVLYDPWWNPAVEAQAIDRSHRIGQTRTVNAYRLIAPGTVEEKIWELQQRKAQTISDVLGEEGFARSLSKDDLEYLFSED